MGDASPRPLAEPHARTAASSRSTKARTFIPAAVAAWLTCPLVVVGDGSRGLARREAGLDVRMLGWLPRNEALGWVRHATALVFLARARVVSRVLLEAGALGVPMAAMDTGGTGDIVEHERTGSVGVRRRASARISRAWWPTNRWLRMAAAARLHVERMFDSRAVVAKVERSTSSRRPAAKEASGA